MIALFPPPFDAVDLGSSSTSLCDMLAGVDGEESGDADAEPIDLGGIRRLSSYTTPAVPTYFHFTINSEARITEALFSDVAIFQENN